MESVEGCLPMLCGHRMHAKCLAELLKHAKFCEPARCPLCRGDIEMFSAADHLSLTGYQNDDEESLKEALKLNPNHVFSLYCLGLFASMNGDLVGAIAFFQRGISAHLPVTATRYYMHRIAAANCQVELATLMFEHDMLPEAKAGLDAAAAKFKRMKLQKSYHFINILMGQASIAGETGRLDDAVAAYEELLTMAPNAEFYSDTMLMYVSTLRAGERCALAVARRFFSARPSALSVSVLAEALMQAGDNEEALSMFEVAQGASTADSVLHINCRFYLGELTQRAERDLEAIEHFVYVTRFQDHVKVAEAHRRLAQIFSKYEMHAQAQTMLAEAARLTL